MALKLLITAATKTEIDPLSGFEYPGIKIDRLVSGVGGISTVWSIMNYLSENTAPDAALNIGIAGSFNKLYPVNSIVVPETDRFADLGIEGAIGFSTIFEAGLEDPFKSPYRDGVLHADRDLISILDISYPLVNGVTVNSASGSELTIARLVSLFNPDIETMEVAAFYYTCIRQNIPGMSVRSISNMVEPRDRSKWDIPNSISLLGIAVKSIIAKIAER